MRVPDREHESRSWRIVEIVPDFRLEDVWALPVEGDREDFVHLLEVMGSLDLAHGSSRATRLLIAVRRRLGGRLGWDGGGGTLVMPGDRASTLSARLPKDLTGPPASPSERGIRFAGFTALYRTDSEWAAELSNRTVHAVVHLAWVERGDGRYGGTLAVYVKPRGRLGELYMKLIAPFRHHIVYPALLREVEQAWGSRAGCH